jgi:bacillolysin
MHRTIRPAAAAIAAWLVFAGASAPTPLAQGVRGRQRIDAVSAADVRSWGQRVDGMLRSGELRLRERRNDLVLSGRQHERSDQYHEGVRVFGADVSRQLERGRVVSVFGNVHAAVAIDTNPEIDEAGVLEIVQERLQAERDLRDEPELVILPGEGDSYKLTWRLRAFRNGDIRQYFVDARTGAVVLDYSELKTQNAQLVIGNSTGVLGDRKKISVQRSGSRFVAEDEGRPPTLRTYDLQGNINRVNDFLVGRVSLSPATELASDDDNNWTDGAAVDAHVYTGWTYDFYFKRFNRRGLNNADVRMVSLVHPARRADFFTALGQQNQEFFDNAFYCCSGIAVYGVGLPAGVTFGGRTFDFMSGALDVVAHEWTHGVTDYTSDLIYLNESGALNEAFSDIMGTSVEFMFQQPGTGNQNADYLIGEDVARPGGFRSMSDPGAFGHPDHYSRRFTGTGDNGGVHINSGIANHAFYLAIEGGTNRTSGLAVQGVGGSNRQQIENVFYRAFTELMPSNSTFATARAATIQAARDLYGANSAAERAVTQAWTAVGVN